MPTMLLLLSKFNTENFNLNKIMEKFVELVQTGKAGCKKKKSSHIKYIP